jgi:hypothetical protein
MTHIVVAGGTSPTLGRSVVTASLSTGHRVTILSRQPEDPTTAAKSAHGADIRYVDYENVESLKAAIAGASVVISVLKIIGDELNLTTHLNLLRATLATSTATRFVPSDWSMYRLAAKQVDPLAHKDTLLQACQDLAASSNRPGFEIAQFKNGGFLNYFAQCAPSAANKPQLLGGLEDNLMLEYIDIASGILPIPVDEHSRPATVSMTHIDDIGRYVAAAMALPAGAWPRSGVINIAGNTFTYEEVRDVLERDCGMKIPHSVVTPSDCDRRKAEADTKLARDGFDMQVFKAGMVAQMQKVICEGVEGGAWEKNTLPDVHAEIRPVGLKEYLTEVWGRK